MGVVDVADNFGSHAVAVGSWVLLVLERHITGHDDVGVEFDGGVGLPDGPVAFP